MFWMRVGGCQRNYLQVRHNLLILVLPWISDWKICTVVFARESKVAATGTQYKKGSEHYVKDNKKKVKFTKEITRLSNTKGSIQK
jgi:hypothetical protein